MQTMAESTPKAVTEGIVESDQYGIVVLSPANRRATRRIVYLDNYGGRAMWEKIKKGDVPPHHLRGCIELVRMGYEVALAEPIPDFIPRHPFPHDLRLYKMARSWLERDDIIFCGHNVLYWLPFLRKIGALRCHIVSHLFAREPLDWGRAHSGIIALTPAAAEHAKKLVPRAKVAHLGWGADLSVFPRLPYSPKWLLHCGIAGRDFPTLNMAAGRISPPLRIIGAWLPENMKWSHNVTVFDGGRAFNFEQKKVSFHDLLHTHYAGSAASLIVTIADNEERFALGFTNLIEAMAMAQPIILTRTGTLPAEIDIEKEGCGLFVPPNDPAALADAMRMLFENRAQAEAMGRASRRICERRYDINFYAANLHAFFESL
jgi:glycosyltransferase involved in cell wall biosynthesis